MKRKLLLLAFATCMAGISLAQERQVKVTGRVTDYETTEPVIQATIQLLALPDSTFRAGATSDLQGYFELAQRLSIGKYVAKVSFVGYGDEYHSFDVTGNTRHIRLDSIRLKTDALLLKEAVIEAQMAQVQVVDDTVVFNAETFRVPEGSMLEELIRKLPGYEVAKDGTVTYNGKTVKKILVDGKEFFSEDKSIAMKNLPANMVKKVKSYEKKSDLAEMTGIDDGEEELVLDLTVKADAKKGWFSNIDLGYGRPTSENHYDINNLYSVKGMVNRFADNEHYSVILSTNNVNDMGFPGGGGRGGGGNGMNQSSMGGFSMAKAFGEEVEKNKYQYQLGGGVRFFHNNSDVQSETASETFLTQGSNNSFSNSRNQSNNRNMRVNADLRFEWRPDTMTNLVFRPSVGYSTSSNWSESASATFNHDPYETIRNHGLDAEPLDSSWVDTENNSRINYSNNQSAGGGESTSANANLTINRKFNNEGRSLTLSLRGGYSSNENHSSSTSFTRLYQRDSIYTINRRNETPSVSYNYNIRAMWSEPLWKATFLQLSYQFSYRYNDSKRSTYNLEPDLENWGIPDWKLPSYYKDSLDYELSRFATYENLDHDITAQLRIIRDKYNMNVGISLLPQHSKMYYKGQNIPDTLVTRTVFNFTPTMNFRYRWSKQTSLRINYRGRSSQPSMTDLLPITDNSNPLNITMGNPGLKPTFTNSLNVRFQDFKAESLQNISANIGLSSTLNSIVNKTTYNEETGGRISQPTNLDGWWSNWNTNAGIAYNTALPNQHYKVSSSTNARYSHQEGYVRTAVAAENQKKFPLTTTRTVTLSERLSGTYQNDWFEITLQGSLNYNHARNEQQASANRDTYDFSYGPSTNINLPWWDLKLSSDISMNSRLGYSDPEFNTNELIWNAQLSKSFLAQNAATVSVQLFDILHQQSNVSRIVNAIMSSDTRYNTVNSYFMVHFIYRLNLFGDRESRKEARAESMPQLPEGTMPPPPSGNRPAMPMRSGGMPPMGGFGGPMGSFRAM